MEIQNLLVSTEFKCMVNSRSRGCIELAPWPFSSFQRSKNAQPIGQDPSSSSICRPTSSHHFERHSPWLD
jgi:hypothetical protein